VVASPRATIGQAVIATSFAVPYYMQSNSAPVPLPPLGSLSSCCSAASRELSWPGPCGPWQGGLRPSRGTSRATATPTHSLAIQAPPPELHRWKSNRPSAPPLFCVREEDERKEKNGLEAFSWVQMQSS
jgi:hypothetical protein